MKAESFDTWSEAYDTCRERNRPLVVLVDDVTNKIFPSGAYHEIDINGKWYDPTKAHTGN